MKLILHHLLKDIRAQRWLLLLSFLVIAMQIGVDLAETQADYHFAGMAEFIRSTMALPLMGTIVWFLLLARLIQSEPVTGSTSFWLTRPVPRAVYIPSKLLFILLFLLIPYLLPLPLDMLHFGVGPAQVWLKFCSALLTDFYLVLIVLWLATFTRAIGEFTALLIGLMLAAIALFGATAYFRFGSYGPHSIELMFTRWGLFMIFFFGGLFVSLLIQHTRRKANAGFLVGLGGVVIAILAGFFWPVRLPLPFPQAFLWYVSSAPQKTDEIKFSDDWQQRFSWQRSRTASQWLGLSAFSPQVSTAPQLPIISNITVTFAPTGGRPETLSNDITGAIPTDFQVNAEKEIATDLPDIQLSNAPLGGGSGLLSLFVIHPAEEHLTGKTGKLNVSLFGRMHTLVRVAQIPLDGPRISRRPGEVIHVARLPRVPQPFVIGDTQDKPVLAVWTLGYSSGTNQFLPPTSYYLLVDLNQRTGTFLQPVQGGISDGLVGVSSKSSRHVFLTLSGNEPLDRMVLYVYQLKPGDYFNAQLNWSNFPMNPK